MSRDKGPRKKQLRTGDGNTPAIIGRRLQTDDPSHLYREVLEPSAEIINNATRGVRSRGASRIVDNYYATLTYPYRIQEWREGSPLKKPPAVAAIAASLGQVSVDSLRRPVTATIEGVRKLGDSVGVCLNYPGYNEESSVLTSVVREVLGFPLNTSMQVGPGILHVGIFAGTLPVGQMKHIESRLPDTLQLGVVQNFDGPI